MFVNEDLGAYLLLYVDDLLIAAASLAAASQSTIAEATNGIGRLFALKRIGPVRQFLGIEITRDRPKGVLYLTQKSYIDKIVAKFGGSDLKLKDTTWTPNFPIPLAWEAIENETNIFRQHVGCVNWLAT